MSTEIFNSLSCCLTSLYKPPSTVCLVHIYCLPSFGSVQSSLYIFTLSLFVRLPWTPIENRVPESIG